MKKERKSLKELMDSDKTLKHSVISNNHWKDEIEATEIKPFDLRLGNFVTHDDYPEETFEVISIELTDECYLIKTAGCKNGIWGNPIDLIKGVELEEEWLLKFGFDCNEENGIFFYKKNPGLINFDLHTNELCHYGSYYPSIKYVHQLQNLWKEIQRETLREEFNLTKEELISNILEDHDHSEIMYGVELEIDPEEVEELILKNLPIDRLKNIYIRSFE